MFTLFTSIKDVTLPFVNLLLKESSFTLFFITEEHYLKNDIFFFNQVFSRDSKWQGTRAKAWLRAFLMLTHSTFSIHNCIVQQTQKKTEPLNFYTFMLLFLHCASTFTFQTLLNLVQECFWKKKKRNWGKKNGRNWDISLKRQTVPSHDAKQKASDLICFKRFLLEKHGSRVPQQPDGTSVHGFNMTRRKTPRRNELADGGAIASDSSRGRCLCNLNNGSCTARQE